MLSCWIPVAWIPVWNRLTSRCPQILHNHTCSFQNLQHPFARSKGWSHLRPQILFATYSHSCENWSPEVGNVWLLTQSTFTVIEKLFGYWFTFYDMLPLIVPCFIFKSTLFFPPRTAIPIRVWPVRLLSGGSVTRSKASSKLVSMILTWILQNSWTTFFICIKCCFYNSLQTILKLRSL